MSSFIRDGIKFEVVDRGGHPLVKPKLGIEGAEMTVTYRVAWGDRYGAINSLLGSSTFADIGGQSFGYIKRVLPHTYEEQYGLLFCKSASYSPEITKTPPAGSFTVNASHALIDATYARMPYDLIPDDDPRMQPDGFTDEATLLRYVSKPPPVCKDKLLQARGTWKWDDLAGDKIVGVDVAGITVNMAEVAYKWHQVPLANVPWAAIFALLNTCNGGLAVSGSDKFDWIEKEHATFSRYGTEEISLPDGGRGVNMIYFFTYFANGANKFPDPKRSMSYHSVVSRSDGASKPYPPANWSTLFRPFPAP